MKIASFVKYVEFGISGVEAIEIARADLKEKLDSIERERERERQHQLQIAQLQYAPKVVKEGKTDLAFIRDDKPQAIFSKSGDQNKKPIIDNSASVAVKKDPELFDEYVGAISFKAPFIFN
jgi:precorrin-6B methylase 2